MAKQRKPAFMGQSTPFATRLGGLMTENDENQSALAKVLGVKQQTISYYRNGQSLPDVERLIKISEHYKVSIDYLLGKRDSPSNEEDIQKIQDYTGLDEEAIKVIAKHKDKVPYMSAINFLLKNDTFLKIIANYFLSFGAVLSTVSEYSDIPIRSDTVRPIDLPDVCFARLISYLPQVRNSYIEYVRSNNIDGNNKLLKEIIISYIEATFDEEASIERFGLQLSIDDIAARFEGNSSGNDCAEIGTPEENEFDSNYEAILQETLEYEAQVYYDDEIKGRHELLQKILSKIFEAQEHGGDL